MTNHARSAVAATVGVLAALGAAGCGSGTPAGRPSVSGVPLVHGAHVVSEARRCDRGAHPYCALQLVLAGPGYPTSQVLLTDEQHHLKRSGWGVAEGDTDFERAAESPGNSLRVTYATATQDLRSIDLGTIQRARPIARALSAQMFARAPALSLMLQSGSS